MMDYLVTRGTVEEATIVFNFLVDVCAIEAVVVCKTQAEAKTISTFAKDVPRYMRKAITLDLYEFIPPPGYKTRYLNPVRNRVIGSDSSQAMDENEREVQHEIKTLKEISSKIETLKKEEDALIGEIIQVRRRKSRMSQELQKIHSELTEIVSEPEISSAKEAVAYMKALHQIVTFLDVSDGNDSVLCTIFSLSIPLAVLSHIIQHLTSDCYSVEF